MIVNSFAVLDGAIALLQTIVGLVVILLTVRSLRAAQANSLDEHGTAEDRFYLLFVLAFLLLGLNVLSWPLLYLLLQSYIPEWPGVMCIYGVTQIGAGSDGPARVLPTLVKILQWLKPLLVFCTGVWFTLYILNRQTQTGALTRRVLAALLLSGVGTLVVSGMELAYLAIPKKEESLATGCCPVAFDRIAENQLAGGQRPALDAAFFIASFGMALALLRYSKRTRPSQWELMILWTAAASTFLIGKAYLTEVLAPSVLHLPYHHCAYDLLADAPESVVGIFLFCWGTLSVGWACLAANLGRDPDTKLALPVLFGRIAFVGFCCYFSAAVMAALEMVLA